MKIYQCDNNWRYLYETDADESPMEPGVFLIPGFATTVKPDISKGTPTWSPTANSWSYQENHLGKIVYNVTTKEPKTIDYLGPIPPEGYTTQVPREFDTWDGSLWITDMVLRNKTLRKQKMSEVNAAFENAMLSVRSEYTESEIMSWAKQESEARKWLRDNTYTTPLIDLIADARGLDKLDLINKVVLKADQYAYATGVAVGRRQQLEDQVNAIAVGQESKLDQIKF